jgi:hypothetical protein
VCVCCEMGTPPSQGRVLCLLTHTVKPCLRIPTPASPPPPALTQPPHAPPCLHLMPNVLHWFLNTTSHLAVPVQSLRFETPVEVEAARGVAAPLHELVKAADG